MNRRPSEPKRAVSLPRALSKLGLCSRSQAFDLIQSGRVLVNGVASKDISLRVSLEDDRIVVDGKALASRREPIVIALHKPVGYVTTRSDPQGRPTVYDLLPPLDRFVFPVGRLDKETSGLLILTDDHRLGETLTSPEHHVPKTYEVIVDAVPDAHALNVLNSGVDIGRGEVTRPAKVDVLDSEDGGIRLRMVIDEGKNRQVRRMMAAVGLTVSGLSRTGIGAYQLGALPPGAIAHLSVVDVARLSEVVACSTASRPRAF